MVDGDLPASIRGRLDAWADCIAGALDQSVYLDKIRAAGFERVEVLSHDTAPIGEEPFEEGVQVIAVRADGQVTDGEESAVSLAGLAHKVASIRVQAFKPA